MSATVKPLGRALRLEVEDDPLPGALVNLVPNPDGELGGWGWLTPVVGSIMEGYPNSSGIRSLRYRAGSGAQYFATEPVPRPFVASAVSGFARWTPSPARNTCTSCPSSTAVRATSNASAARVAFSGPVAE